MDGSRRQRTSGLGNISGGEAQFRQALEALPVGAYTCDRDGLITYFNKHAVEIWGRAPALNDPVDRFCGSFKLFDVDLQPIRHDRCWMALALANGKEYNGCEIVIERPDGSRVTTLAHANPIRDESGSVVGAVNLLVDISDRKRAAEALRADVAEQRETAEALRQADRHKDEFLATLAHELRNPLAPIVNSLQILRMTQDQDPSVEKVCQIMERQTNLLVRLVDDLLEVSRIAQGKTDLRRETLDLAAVIRSAVETSRPQIDAGGHQLAISVPPRPMLVNADPDRLAQVIANLLNNAAKYTPPGGQIWLTSRPARGQVTISVRDNGVGISPEQLPRVFEMFAQGKAPEARPLGGLGIGLTLAKSLVQLHGGQLEARSDGLGKGSQFTVTLPLADPAALAAAPVAEPLGDVAGARRILVVDDRRDTAAILGKLLESLGHEVFTASDGNSALKLARAERPDVVISDISMVDMDGYELARRLRREPGLEGILLIALTGYEQESERRRSAAAGFDHHLVKPVSVNVLEQTLSTLPERQRTGP